MEPLKNHQVVGDINQSTASKQLYHSSWIGTLKTTTFIIRGDMSVVGPRPLAVQYLPYYTEKERKRHSVRPGLSGLAQINGRNAVDWPQRFAYDLDYVENISFALDLKIILKTVLKAIKREGVAVRGTSVTIDFDKYRILENEGKLENDKISVRD